MEVDTSMVTSVKADARIKDYPGREVVKKYFNYAETYDNKLAAVSAY